MDFVDEGEEAYWRCSDTVNCGHEEHDDEEEPEDLTCPTCGGQKEKVMIDGLQTIECPPCWQKQLEDQRRARFGDPEKDLRKALSSGGGIF
jgi:hypothetical protein